MQEARIRLLQPEAILRAYFKVAVASLISAPPVLSSLSRNLLLLVSRPATGLEQILIRFHK